MNNKNLINGKKPEFGNLEQIKVLQAKEREIEEEKEAKDFYNNLSADAKYCDDLFSIDWCFMVLDLNVEAIKKRLNGRDPITKMIDDCTGYEKALIKKFLLDLKEGYTELIKLFKRIDDEERETEYKSLLDKINATLKTEYKKVKEVNYHYK